MKNGNNKFGYLQIYGKYFSLIFQMIFLVVIGGFGGKYLDGLFNFEKPVFAVVLIIFAAILSLYLFFTTIFKK